MPEDIFRKNEKRICRICHPQSWIFDSQQRSISSSRQHFRETDIWRSFFPLKKRVKKGIFSGCQAFFQFVVFFSFVYKPKMRVLFFLALLLSALLAQETTGERTTGTTSERPPTTGTTSERPPTTGTT